MPSTASPGGEADGANPAVEGYLQFWICDLGVRHGRSRVRGDHRVRGAKSIARAPVGKPETRWLSLFPSVPLPSPRLRAFPCARPHCFLTVGSGYHDGNIPRSEEASWLPAGLGQFALLTNVGKYFIPTHVGIARCRDVPPQAAHDDSARIEANLCSARNTATPARIPKAEREEGPGKKMLKMEIDPNMCMKTQGRHQNRDDISPVFGAILARNRARRGSQA